MIDHKYLHQKNILGTYPNRGLQLNRGDGVYLYDEQNTAYLDFMTNYGVNIMGHAHPIITKTLTDQLAILTTLHGSFMNDQRSKAAQLLVDRCGDSLQYVYFSNSGAEAVEAALKFAVLATGKKRFISCEHGYHGKTLGALSATAGEKYKAPFRPLLWDFQTIPFNDTKALEATIDNQTAAFIVEPIQGEGGIITPSKDYLGQVSEICKRRGILLIIDEIQTGLGRTGTFLTSQKSNISYDIVCLGKGLAGGIPVGATLVSAKIAAHIPRGSHTSTFGGNPLACAGINATVEFLNDKMLAHVQSTGDYFMKQLTTLPKTHVKAVRGAGLMIGIDVGVVRNDILKSLQKNKILAIPAGDSTVRFLPPYIIEKKHIDRIINALVIILKPNH